MDIQPISSNKFIVGLSCEDMKMLDITYDEMDYSNIETKRVIWTILDTVRKSTGRDVDPSGDIVIEATPDISGGCMLIFTVPACKKTTGIGMVISKSESTQIFEFNDIDAILDMCKSTDVTGDIFTDGEKFRIEFSSDKIGLCRHIIEEYGRFVGKDSVTAAITHEHWKLLSSAKN